MKYTKDQIEEARKYLLEMMEKCGRRVYTSVSNVSSSGMSRHIHCYILVDGQIRNITNSVGAICGYRQSDKSYGLVVGGCGMDMGFAVVYNLGCSLYPGGDGVTITRRNGSTEPETDGGYLIKQEWL